MNLTAKQMIPAIGQRVLVRFEDLQIECRVQDVKQSYGRIRLLIVPVSGTSNQWVEMQRVSLLTDSTKLSEVIQ